MDAMPQSSENAYIYIYISGQIIATSHDLTPNGGLVREISYFRKSRLVKYCDLARYIHIYLQIYLYTFISIHTYIYTYLNICR